MSDRPGARPNSPQPQTKAARPRPAKSVLGSPLLDQKDPLVGQVLQNADRSGSYKILKRIGKGGMGYVYLAEDSEGGENVALKVLHPKFDEEVRQQMVNRFLVEAQATIVVNHKNTVKITDVGIYDGDPFVVMEYLEGKELDKLLRKGRRLEWNFAKTILLQMCKGLEAAHKKGIIHRDLKPANTIILQKGNEFVVKVLDFGLAKFTREADENFTRIIDKELTRDGFFVGTSFYTSPEQASGKRDYDKRADVYSLGVIMYKMLTGSVPFDGESDLEILHKHIFSEPIPPSEKNPKADIPPGVERIILKAMKKNPEHRFKDMAEMRRAIENDGEGFSEERLLDSEGGQPAASDLPPIPEPPDLLEICDSEISGIDSREYTFSDQEMTPTPSDYAQSERKGSALWTSIKVVVVLAALGLGGYFGGKYVHDNWGHIRRDAAEWVNRQKRSIESNESAPAADAGPVQTKSSSYRISLETLPRGAQVYIEENLGGRKTRRRIGNTSKIMNRIMPAGEHTLIVMKSGYEEETLRTHPGQKTYVVSLRRRR